VGLAGAPPPRPAVDPREAALTAGSPVSRALLDLDTAKLSPERPPAMVLGGLSLVRALGLASIPCVLATADPRDPTLRSRYVTGACWLPRGRDRAGVAEALVEAGERLHHALGRRVPLFYANDDDLQLVYAHRDALARHYLLTLNEPALALALLEKDRFEDVARAHGLPVPRAWSLGPEGRAALGASDGPKVVKPRRKTNWKDSALRRSFGEGKALVFASARDLLERLPVDALADELSVQDYVPGDDRQLLSFHGFANEEGRLLAWFVGRKVRTYPAHTGESSFLELVHDAPVAALGRELTAKLALKGIFKMDLKRDPRDGRLYLLEINARCSLWNYLGAANGMNLPAVAYDHLVHGRGEGPAGYRTRYRWLKAPLDLKAFRELHARGELSFGRWLASILLGRRVHHRFAWSDPAPLLGGWRRRLGRRLERWHATAS
jgi:predicted ATP-grasp superfamily ATP-dependent carboligase